MVNFRNTDSSLKTHLGTIKDYMLWFLGISSMLQNVV